MLARQLPLQMYPLVEMNAQMNKLRARKDSYLQMVEKISTQGYLGLALSAIIASALLRIAGKKEAALFVGQWPPTFILFALAHKLLRPSQERGSQATREALDEAARLAGPGFAP